MISFGGPKMRVTFSICSMSPIADIRNALGAILPGKIKGSGMQISVPRMFDRRLQKTPF